MLMGQHYWTREEEQFIRRNWKKMTDIEMAEHLGMTRKAVGSKRGALGFSRDTGLPVRPASKYFDPHQYECWLTGEPRYITK